jgi:hypothetical protein
MWSPEGFVVTVMGTNDAVSMNVTAVGVQAEHDAVT